MTDIVDTLLATANATPPGAETTPGARALGKIRSRRPVTREQTQASYDALFTPVEEGDFSVAERWLVAAFVTRLVADDAVSAHYAARAVDVDAVRAETVLVEASGAATAGPYGTYAEAGLQSESVEGPRYRAGTARPVLGGRLAAALEHAHLLVLHPRDSDESALDALLDAGWSIDGIVALSQLVSFLSYQQRVVHGLRVLTEEKNV